MQEGENTEMQLVETLSETLLNPDALNIEMLSSSSSLCSSEDNY